MQCIAEDATAFLILVLIRIGIDRSLSKKSKATHKSCSKHRYDLGQ